VFDFEDGDSKRDRASEGRSRVAERQARSAEIVAAATDSDDTQSLMPGPQRLDTAADGGAAS
jgi:hypothetical protein